MLVAILGIVTALASACTDSEDGGDPALEDGQIQPGEQ